MSDNKPSFSPGKWIFRLVLFIVIILLLADFICSVGISNGSQAGVLMKFARRGLIIKTYEGELNTGGMGNIPNTAQANQMWDFSVVDGKVADTLMQYSGRRVSLHYHQVVKNMFWQGETPYFVDGVQVLNN